MTGTNIDIVLVVQSLIVLFIALPPLVRTGQDRVRSRRGRGTTTTATEGGRA
jgi:general nucleoside transport system permease protein